MKLLLTSSVISVIFVFAVSYYAVPGSSLFSWHPVCMTIVFQLVMLQGILAFSADESHYLAGSKRNFKVFIHWIFQSLAAVLILLGFLSIFFNKSRNGKSHFTSWHGLGGLLTCILVIGVNIGGILSKYPKLVTSFMSVSTTRRIHAVFASLLFFGACVTTIFGLNSVWALSVMSFPLPYILMAVIPINAVIVLKQVYNNRLKAILGK